ncbi:glycyl radical protein [Vagococcus sp.]|uniref:glycyl radical protein n=1 Tax=Vagococcus sp. TaxID=1933889 RepID=UPI003F97186C
MFDTKISPRANVLKQRFFEDDPGLCSERARIITEAYQEFASDPAPILRAKALQRILEKMTIWIGTDELIVGNQAKKPRYSPVFPEFSFEWIIDELDNEPFEEREADRFLVDETVKRELHEIKDYWQGKTVNDLVTHRIPEETLDVVANSAVYTFSSDVIICSGVGHYSPNYQTILTKGFLQIKQEAEHNIEKMGIPANGTEIDRYNFWKSITIVSQAVMDFANRYAEKALELALGETNIYRKKELLEIAQVCHRVPAHPAETFYEACQSFYFFQLVLQLESSGHSISPGRFDQYMFPYYQADLEKGTLTLEEGMELLECLWIKLAEINKVRPIGSTKAFGGYPMFQNLCVGGQTRDGKDATNDLSYMCLQASNNIRLHQPSITARLWNDTPQELWTKIIQVTKGGLGMPALYNDEVIIPGMLNRGKSIEDARDYAIIGCVEPGAQGYEYAWSGGTGDAPFFSMPACLEYAINDGKNLMTGKQAGLQTGKLSEFETFEDVKTAFEKQLQYFVDHFTLITNTADIVHQENIPLPFLSCGIEPCVERGLDVTHGGAKYNATGTAGVGVSNAGDSLMALKHFVFDNPIVNKAEFLEILKNNWENEDVLRSRFIAEVPHFGNDNEAADELASWVATRYCEMTEEAEGVRGPYSPGLYPVSANVPMGAGMGASADGRRAGEPLADGISPVHGRDKNGPTSLLNSAAKIDHLINSNGTLLNMKFHPSAVDGEKGEKSLETLLKTYFNSKGLHVQYNVVSSKRLRDAQKYPDKYKSLVVRVAGYSALFVGLDPELQEDIITRTEISELS